ncbi:hypothetical protein F8388_022286 [Cannabis sativa]|uniref:Uncharacterized protein n=1 Tax=Cannabis sativa TaxID=3483 RepID=A0A7J6DNA4_CANSA|nr:hypothetical protein F8388_022286 [Cannabis sativa]
MGNYLLRFGEDSAVLRSPFPVSLSRLTQVAFDHSVLSFHAWNVPSLLAHHPGVEIHQSLLIEEEKRALYTFAGVMMSGKGHADKAATKAMPINRVGDFELALGISGRFTLFQIVDFSTIFSRASAPRNSWISCNMRLNAITLMPINYYFT